jgi:hypothetical protein
MTAPHVFRNRYVAVFQMNRSSDEALPQHGSDWWEGDLCRVNLESNTPQSPMRAHKTSVQNCSEAMGRGKFAGNQKSRCKLGESFCIKARYIKLAPGLVCPRLQPSSPLVLVSITTYQTISVARDCSTSVLAGNEEHATFRCVGCGGHWRIGSVDYCCSCSLGPGSHCVLLQSNGALLSHYLGF